MGCIYIIENDVNNKVYIGQTVHTCERRFAEHVRKARREEFKTKLCRAMREIGIEHFKVRQLIECDDSELTKQETFFVNKYNSINDGYNSVYPVDAPEHITYREYYKDVCEQYSDGVSCIQIAKNCKISQKEVYKIIKLYGLHRDSSKNGHGSEPITVIMFNKKFEPLRVFHSIKEAYLWLLKNSEFKVTKFGAYAYISVACENGTIAYGYRWQDASKLEYDNKIFRSIFDVESYKNGSVAYIPQGKKYYVCDGALNKIKGFQF